jgi:hypothetical protein
MEIKTHIMLNIKPSGCFEVLEANLRIGLRYGMWNRTMAVNLLEKFHRPFTIFHFLGLI